MVNKYYINTGANERSGESVEMIQLAKAIGAQTVKNVPPEGLFIYLNNINIHSGVEYFQALAERKYNRRGKNIIICGVCRSLEETERWRPYFNVLGKISDLIFVHHHKQIEYLRQYGIEAVFKFINEERYCGEDIFEPNTVLYTGFLWEEKNISMIFDVAGLMPSWKFTIHFANVIDLNVAKTPPNIKIVKDFIPQNEYPAFLAKYEYIWLPRRPSPWIYSGRSGLTAVASTRPAIITDVMVNDIIPSDVAIKYPHNWNAKKIANLIKSRPLPNHSSVQSFLDKISPAVVWKQMQLEFRRAGWKEF
jgi:glycosyltransferase involved in cell wall biosynthesis